MVDGCVYVFFGSFYVFFTDPDRIGWIVTDPDRIGSGHFLGHRSDPKSAGSGIGSDRTDPSLITTAGYKSQNVEPSQKFRNIFAVMCCFPAVYVRILIYIYTYKNTAGSVGKNPS